ncbi:hypothetical protein BZA70DRAFT_126350 [Myxozyma melibiosi]|uniref:KOW domain-containing protein n=1 Tax=Myxozyma melibiosi TaxID=54550 RepID=A0ABR1F8K8_9ASCO
MRIPRFSALARQLRRKDLTAKNKNAETGRKTAPFIPGFMTDDHLVDEPLKNIPFKPNDIVQVIKPGPDFGKITRVHYVGDRMGVALENVGPKHTTVLPKSHWREGQTSYVYTFNGFTHPKDLRLITTVKDDKTGEMVHAAVNKLKLGEEYYDDRYKTRLRRRYVANTGGVSIPWPDPVDEVTEGNFVTPYDEARERTFFVTDATIPPVPKVALDSLRNPYAWKLKPDLTEEEIHRLTPPKMPLTEAKKARIAEVQALLKKQEERELSGEAERIRELTAKALKQRLDAADRLKKAAKQAEA